VVTCWTERRARRMSGTCDSCNPKRSEQLESSRARVPLLSNLSSSSPAWLELTPARSNTSSLAVFVAVLLAISTIYGSPNFRRNNCNLSYVQHNHAKMLLEALLKSREVAMYPLQRCHTSKDLLQCEVPKGGKPFFIFLVYYIQSTQMKL